MNIKHSLYSLLAGSLLTAVSLPGAAADVAAGQELHNANCVTCHDSSVYTRENRKVTSLSALRRQVKRCELSLGLTLFDEQVEDIAQYLNTTYYKVQ